MRLLLPWKALEDSRISNTAKSAKTALNLAGEDEAHMARVVGLAEAVWC